MAGINPALVGDLDARIAAIHAPFVKEQQAGYETLEQNLRAWTHSHLHESQIDAPADLARRTRARFRAFVLVGIGGSDLGARTLNDTLDAPLSQPACPRRAWRRPRDLFHLFASPVGLLPFGVTVIGEEPRARIDSALKGHAKAHERFLLPPTDDSNTAAKLARFWHLAEQYGRVTDLVFCNYEDAARLSDWFVQLYEESVQERGGGLNVIGTRGPTGNHSILNGILRGPHDKLVLMVRWGDLGPDLEIPTGSGIEGDLEAFEGLPMAAVQDVSCRATAADYLANGVPTATLNVARRDGYHLFLLMRTLMDPVAIKGRLQDLAISADGRTDPAADLTYRQGGVEGYKTGTRGNAVELHKTEKEVGSG